MAVLTASAATIITGLLALGGSLGTGIMNNKANEEAGEKQYGLALLARSDDLNKQRSDAAISNRSLGIKEGELSLGRSAQNYKQQSEKKLLRQQQLLNLGTSLDTLSKKDANMTNFVLSLMGKNTYNANAQKGIGA
jgi:hypothetical protein